MGTACVSPSAQTPPIHPSHPGCHSSPCCSEKLSWKYSILWKLTLTSQPFCKLTAVKIEIWHHLLNVGHLKAIIKQPVQFFWSNCTEYRTQSLYVQLRIKCRACMCSLAQCRAVKWRIQCTACRSDNISLWEIGWHQGSWVIYCNHYYTLHSTLQTAYCPLHIAH